MAAIAFSVAEPLGAAAGADVEGAELGVELDVELVLLLPQAARPAPSTHARRTPGTDL
ncbi:MAG TPA: hypothetical protein VLW50_15395 [Streptosporangiaceae bacterium]|nr:hypothetical protein [Streptosporangiaceae bacterium]